MSNVIVTAVTNLAHNGRLVEAEHDLEVSAELAESLIERGVARAKGTAKAAAAKVEDATAAVESDVKPAKSAGRRKTPAKTA